MRILEDAHRYEDVLSLLSEQSSRIVDRSSVLETRARVLGRLGRWGEAGAEWGKLVERNWENDKFIVSMLGRYEACYELQN